MKVEKTHHLHTAMTATLAVAGVLAATGFDAQAAGLPKAKNIILFIGDGMQLEHEIATSQYLFGKERQLSFHRLGYSAPVSTWDVTWNNTLLIVTSNHSNSYMRLGRDGKQPLLDKGELPKTIGQITFDDAADAVYTPLEAEVFYGTGNHTSELVMLYARGKGIDSLAKRQGKWYRGTQILDNTQLFEAVAEAAGLTR